MESCWSTSGFFGENALSKWKGIVREAMVEMDVTSPDPRIFSANLVQRRFDRLTLNAVLCEQVEVVRSCSMVARNPGNDIFLVCARSGNFMVEQEGRTAYAKAGDGVLLDTRYAYRLSSSSGFNNLTISVASDWLERFVPRTEYHLAKTISGEGGWGQVLSNTMAMFAHDDSFNIISESALAEHWAIGLSLALGRTSEPSATLTSYRRTLLARFRASMRDRFAEPHFSPALLAAEHGVSKRSLHETFAYAGTSFGQELASQRLRAARAILGEARFIELPISEVAWRCGFSDPSYFARCFQRQFGISPSAYRSKESSY